MKPRISASPADRYTSRSSRPGDEEEQRAQPEQRERVGDEHDVGVLGDAEHRRDRVQREQQVGAADRDQHQEQRRENAPAPRPDDDLAAVVVAGDR